MDHNDSARRQYEAYATQSSSQPAQYSNTGSVERFLQHSFLQQSPTSGSSSARPEGSSNGTRGVHTGDGQSQQDQLYSFSGYGGVSSLQQYQPDVGTNPPSRSSQHQAQLPPPQSAQPSSAQSSLYPSSYGSGVMYGMAQTHQSPYDHVPQFRSRPAAAAGSDSLSNQFTVSQGQYYLPPHAIPTAGAGSGDFTAPHLSSQYHPSTGYQQGGPSPPSAYSTSAMLGGSSQTGAYSSYAQSQSAAYSASQPSQSIDQAFNEYQSRVRTIFTSVRDGTLRDIVVQLLNISHYLLGNAEALGLTRDDDALHDDRIRLWDEFNRAWLATLQRQFDLTQEMMQSNQSVREPQSILTQQSLEHLSRELVRMCDSVEKHGLVDYQMGVAEEEIMDLLLRCLQLLDPPHDKASETGTAGTGEASAERHMA